MKKYRQLSSNLVLSGLVLVLLYAGIEYCFPRVFSSLFPMNMVSKFEEPDGIWPVLQSSKKTFIPRDYLALAGDSYAMGMGDAMVQAGHLYRPRFHSAHVIEDVTGRDVVSFGLPGSGSIRGAISNPVAGLHYLRKLVDSRFPDPSWIILYFYEGNDLTENWMYYEKTFLPDHAAADYEKPAIFDEYVRRVALGRQHLYLAADAARWKNRLFFSRFASRLFSEKFLGRKFYRKKYPGEFGLIYVPENRWQPLKIEQPVNHAVIDGQIVPLPDNLQGPAMDLSDDQLQHALGTFDKALAWSRSHFPGTRFAVVYIPSVLSIYRLAGEEALAQNYFNDNHAAVSVARLQERHARILEEVLRICRKQGVSFVDASEDLQAAASKQVLHGPNDWNHFNEAGYRLLGRSVARQLPLAEEPR